MTLLEATALLIDCARTYGPEQDRVLARAVKRMEKRLAVLQKRHGKALLSRLHRGWIVLRIVLRSVTPTCPTCETAITYGDFIRTAELWGDGCIKNFPCPAGCGWVLINPPWSPECHEALQLETRRRKEFA